MAAVPAPMAASTANWHWKNKTVTPWAKAWFERELTAISVNGAEGETVAITKVVDVDGDVELGQRKSKLITIYDCRVELQWTGTKDGEEVKGTLSIPEVSHEVTLDKTSDYVYEWSLSTSSPASDALLILAKKALPPVLESKLAEFPQAIVDTHGRDLQVGADGSRGGTPAPSASASASGTSTPAPAPKKQARAESAKINTATVNVSATFMAAADDLFSLLTDEKRIPMWTRAPAVSAAKAGTEYSLFAGGVKGKYVELTPSKEIVQTWALSSPTWQEGHVAVLTTKLEQSTDSTTVTWSLAGVPLGLEEETQRNLNGYYVHGLKSIGYVHLVEWVPPQQKVALSDPAPESRASASASASPAQEQTVPESIPLREYLAFAIAILAIVAAFATPYLYS